MSTSTSEEQSTEQQANESKIDDNSTTNPKEQIPSKHTKTRSKSDVAAKILQQTWKYPHKQVSVLLDDENVTVQRIMDTTKCKIYLNSTNYSQHKMVEITLEGTSDEIFNGHKEINYIRQNGHLMNDNDRKPNRFNRKQPKKLKNWNLDVSDASMLAAINDILDKSHATDWAMFRFIDNNQQEMQENVKYLSIDTYGSGGVQNLALHLSNIAELKYCLLRFDYGFDIQKHQIILIIYSPSTARNGQKRNIIPILRHKSLIKKTLCATSVITISIHSYLNPSFILSELHNKNLVPEILLRVTKTKTIRNRNEDEDDFKTHHHNHNDDDDNTVKTDKFFASKQWTLARLQLELSKKYMNDTEIQITHILYNVTKRSKTFHSRRETEHIFNNAQDLDKTLSQLKLYHGSRIYISDISQQNDKNTHNKTLTNIFLAAQRRAQFTKTKTMSKTKKIKIKLKLSSHIRKIKSLKSMRKRECDENLSKNVSLRIAQYEENETKRNLQNVKTRVKAKSFSSPRKKLLQPQTERKFDEQEEELTMSVSSRLLQYRQTSISDTEINELEVENVNTHFVTTHSEPTLTHSQRTRSLSQNMMKNVFVDKHFLEEYTNLLPQIFEPVVVQSKGKKKPLPLPLPLPLPPVIKQEEEEAEEAEEERTEIECTLDLNQVFIVERSVGRGKTAHVHYAIYRDECDIALKEFRFGRLTEKILIDFHAELETLKKLDHDNICRLLGHFVDENSKQLYLAFEWCPCGCLYEVIHDKSVGIQFIDVLEMSLDIAKGMQYLHSQNIIHRDLKSHNLLLDEAYRVKITDFGTAKTLEKIGGTTYTEVGTGGYCAPEVIEPPLQGYDSKIDVFSFGVLMWEIYTRKNIFDQRCLRNINQLRNGIRPKLGDCPVKYEQLIQQCWQFNPLFRPNFDQIVTILLQLYADQQQSIK